MLSRRSLFRVLCLVFVFCSPLNCLSATDDPRPARPDGRVHLMLEEELIARSHGVKRIGHVAKKIDGARVLKADLPSDGDGVQSACVRYVDGEFRMWYHPLHPNERGGVDLFVCYATSNDGIVWQKPRLGLFEFNGSKENNLVLSGKPTFLEMPSVIVDDSLPPERRFTMFGNTPGGGNKLGAFYSPDGVNWTAFSGNPIERTIHTSDQVYVEWDAWQRRYICFCKEDFRIEDPQLQRQLVAPWGRVQRFMVCTDRERLRPWRAIGPGELGEQFGHRDTEWPLHQYYGVVPVCYEGNYLGMLAVYHSIPEDDGIDSEWVYSRDGDQWRMTSHRTRIVERGQSSTWDSASAFVSALVPVDDEIWIYYGGSIARHGPPEKDVERPANYFHSSIGLAKLRRDGFASLEPTHETGWLETVALACAGQRLLVNADATGGSCLVELRDEQGRALTGFSADECRPIRGDNTRHVAQWASGAELAHLIGKPVRVRFLLNGARLFAFRFVD